MAIGYTYEGFSLIVLRGRLRLRLKQDENIGGI